MMEIKVVLYDRNSKHNREVTLLPLTNKSKGQRNYAIFESKTGLYHQLGYLYSRYVQTEKSRNAFGFTVKDAVIYTKECLRD